MEMSGQPHPTVALPLGEEPSIPIEEEDGWTPYSVWTFWRTGDAFSYQDLNPGSSCP